MLGRYKKHNYLKIKHSYIEDDKKLFIKFFREYNGKLLKYIKYKWDSISPEDVQDVVQDTWMKFINGFSTNVVVENNDFPYSFIKQIAYNTASDLVRRRNNLKEITDVLFKDSKNIIEQNPILLYKTLEKLEISGGELYRIFKKLDCKCRYFLIARFHLITRSYVIELETIKKSSPKDCESLISLLQPSLPPTNKSDEYYDVLTEHDIFNMTENYINQTKSRCLDKIPKRVVDDLLDKAKKGR